MRVVVLDEMPRSWMGGEEGSRISAAREAAVYNTRRWSSPMSFSGRLPRFWYIVVGKYTATYIILPRSIYYP